MCDLITLEKINKYYKVGNGKFHALKDATLTIRAGELVALQGRSGAGKSTLLQILGCLDTFDTGAYFFDGISVQSLHDEKNARLRNENIGIVLQDFTLINQKSVLFNVMLPMYFNKTPYRMMKKNALAALEIVGLEDQQRKKANQLSGGQRQRVAIARAIVNHPKLLLADEPTGALDQKTGQDIMDLFLSLNQAGTTVVIVTHDDTIARQCPRIVQIADGVIVP